MVDLLGGQAIGPDEAQHLVALAGAALLVWQSLTVKTESAAPAIVPAEGPAVAPGGHPEAPAVARLDRAADRPRGGDAARIAAPAVADQRGASQDARPDDGDEARGEAVA
jgi:hypothetical protein